VHNVKATLSNVTCRTILSTKSNVASTLLHVQFVLTSSKGRNFAKNLSDNVAQNGNNVEATFDSIEATFDFVERIVRLVAFDNVASTLLLVWTGLKNAA